MRINYSELEQAFEFVSIDGFEEHQAFVSLETGKIYWVSADMDEEPPPDLEEEGKYLEIPAKRDLHLGKSLALKFASEYLPDDLDDVYRYFRKAGAYSRFKNLLEERDRLQQWYDYEQDSIKQALIDWCRENSIDVDT